MLKIVLLVISSIAFAENSKLRSLEESYLKIAVKNDLMKFSKIEISGLEHIQKLPEKNPEHLVLKVFKGQKLKNNGVRAEISIDFPYEEGDSVTYEWDFLIPKETVGDPLKRWWIIGNWHDQPNPKKNENWDNFPKRSSPIILGYGVVDGKDLVTLSYGAPDSKPVGKIEIQKDKWNHLKVKINWSRKALGEVQVFFNNSDKPQMEAKGPNMHNDYQHYLKVGMYRHPEISGAASIFLKNIEIRKNTDELKK